MKKERELFYSLAAFVYSTRPELATRFFELDNEVVLSLDISIHPYSLYLYK
jgi:hypothetical protein